MKTYLKQKSASLFKEAKLVFLGGEAQEKRTEITPKKVEGEYYDESTPAILEQKSKDAERYGKELLRLINEKLVNSLAHNADADFVSKLRTKYKEVKDLIYKVTIGYQIGDFIQKENKEAIEKTGKAKYNDLPFPSFEDISDLAGKKKFSKIFSKDLDTVLASLNIISQQAGVGKAFDDYINARSK